MKHEVCLKIVHHGQQKNFCSLLTRAKDFISPRSSLFPAMDQVCTNCYLSAAESDIAKQFSRKQ
jgi:hypothetical protein